MPQMVEHLVGEGDETERFSQFATLRRFSDRVWKERRLGNAKLLLQKKTGKVRFLPRHKNTIGCNFYVMQDAQHCVLKPSASSERTWVLKAFDCSDGLPRPTQLALDFWSKELAVKFVRAFEEA